MNRTTVKALSHVGASLALVVLLGIAGLIVVLLIADVLFGAQLLSDLMPKTVEYELTQPQSESAADISTLPELALARGIAEEAWLAPGNGGQKLVLVEIPESGSPLIFLREQGYPVSRFSMSRFNPAVSVRRFSNSTVLFPVVLLCQFVAMAIVGHYRSGSGSPATPEGRSIASVSGAVGIGVGIGILATVAGAMLVYLQGLVGLEVTEQPWVEPVLRGSPQSVILFSVLIVLAAPISEEIFFRGYVFSHLAARTSSTFAYIASALMFAGIHFNPSASLVYVTYGLLLAFALAKTRRLLGAVAAHATINAISIALTGLGQNL